jgi:hypothetical protein
MPLSCDWCRISSRFTGAQKTDKLTFASLSKSSGVDGSVSFVPGETAGSSWDMIASIPGGKEGRESSSGDQVLVDLATN